MQLGPLLLPCGLWGSNSECLYLSVITPALHLYALRQGHSLNPKLTDSAWLTDEQASETSLPLSVFPKTGVTDLKCHMS